MSDTVKIKVQIRPGNRPGLFEMHLVNTHHAFACFYNEAAAKDACEAVNAAGGINWSGALPPGVTNQQVGLAKGILVG